MHSYIYIYVCNVCFSDFIQGVFAVICMHVPYVLCVHLYSITNVRT